MARRSFSHWPAKFLCSLMGIFSFAWPKKQAHLASLLSGFAIISFSMLNVLWGSFHPVLIIPALGCGGVVLSFWNILQTTDTQAHMHACMHIQIAFATKSTKCPEYKSRGYRSTMAPDALWEPSYRYPCAGMRQQFRDACSSWRPKADTKIREKILNVNPQGKDTLLCLSS